MAEHTHKFHNIPVNVEHKLKSSTGLVLSSRVELAPLGSYNNPDPFVINLHGSVFPKTFPTLFWFHVGHLL